MIKQVKLRVGIPTTQVGLGTSRLHYLQGTERQRLLGAALDYGISHFDTAPVYGDGLAERSMGQFLRGRRDRCVLVTKYGVPPDPVAESMPFLFPAWRIVRSMGRRTGLFNSSLPPLTASGLLRSVEHSLRRLATDYIDILLLHVPTVARLQDAQMLIEQLEQLRAKGTIRAFGVSGDWADLAPIVLGQSASLGQVIQTGEGEWQEDYQPDITYGAISQGRQSYFQDALSTEVVEQRLINALRKRPQGVVLVSTTKIDNLKRLVQVAQAGQQ